jgi:hypothetical protein
MTSPDEKHTTLPCAVCRKPLERMDGHHDIPYAANIFISFGHEGATAYDAPGGEHLEMFICTECLEVMKTNAVIDRVLHATAAAPVVSNLWGSPEDPCEDNPWNKQRLRNEWALMDCYENMLGMNEEWAGRLYAECQEASRDGRAFNPASVPA